MQAIITSAGRLFGEFRYDAATAALIGNAAGVSEGTVYYYPDKAAVFRAIFVRDQVEWRHAVAEASTHADPLTAVLGRLRHLVLLAGDPGAPR